MEIEPVYLLPFDVSKHPVRISQGRNGPWSHFRQGLNDYTNAVDFALSLDTEVLAARSGRLIRFRDSSDLFYEGLDPKIGNGPEISNASNYVAILHEDEKTMAVYSHLAKGSIIRKDFFNQGDILAYTGRSGWIGQIPHLHFHVSAMFLSSRSLPVEFREYDGSLDHETLLREGKIYFGDSPKSKFPSVAKICTGILNFGKRVLNLKP